MHDRIENAEQSADDRDQGLLLGCAAAEQALIERRQQRIAARRAECRHVQRTSPSQPKATSRLSLLTSMPIYNSPAILRVLLWHTRPCTIRARTAARATVRALPLIGRGGADSPTASNDLGSNGLPRPSDPCSQQADVNIQGSKVRVLAQRTSWRATKILPLLSSCHSERSEESRTPSLQADLRLTLSFLIPSPQPGQKCRTEFIPSPWDNYHSEGRLTVILKGQRPVESRLFFLALFQLLKV